MIKRKVVFPPYFKLFLKMVQKNKINHNLFLEFCHYPFPNNQYQQDQQQEYFKIMYK